MPSNFESTGRLSTFSSKLTAQVQGRRARVCGRKCYFFLPTISTLGAACTHSAFLSFWNRF